MPGKIYLALSKNSVFENEPMLSCHNISHNLKKIGFTLCHTISIKNRNHGLLNVAGIHAVKLTPPAWGKSR